MKKPLNRPQFKNEDKEREYWSNINLADYLEPSDFVPVSFPNLKSTTRPVAIRMPLSLIHRIKERANAIGVPYQSWVKIKLSELIEAEEKQSKHQSA